MLQESRGEIFVQLYDARETHWREEVVSYYLAVQISVNPKQSLPVQSLCTNPKHLWPNCLLHSPILPAEQTVTHLDVVMARLVPTLIVREHHLAFPGLLTHSRWAPGKGSLRNYADWLRMGSYCESRDLQAP